jgi:hypothetical protein
MKNAIVWTLLGLTLLASPSVMAEPQRVEFKTGATSARVSGLIKGYQLKEYRFRAQKGQQLELSVESKRANWLVIGVLTEGSDSANVYSNFIDGTTEFKGELPKDGDYILRLGINRAEARREGVVDYAATIKILPVKSAKSADLIGSGRYHVSGNEPVRFQSMKLDLSPNGQFHLGVSLRGDGFSLDGTWHKGPDGAIAVDIKRFAGIGDVNGSGLIVLDKAGRPSHFNLYFFYPEQKTLHALSFEVK